MGGTWSPTNPPADPGFYVNFEALATATVNGGETGVVLMPLHDAVWGPTDRVEHLYSLSEYDRIYTKTDCGARRAVAAAFTGTGYAPGANRVLVKRLVGAAQPSPCQTSAMGYTLNGKYVGGHIDGWEIALEVNPVDPEDYELVLRDGEGVEKWAYAFTAADDSAVAEAIEHAAANNNWFVTVNPDDTYDSNEPQTGTFSANGQADDPPVTASEVTEFIEAELLNNSYNVATSYSAEYGELIAVAAVEYNLEGKRFLVVTGGELGETVDMAVASANGINNENVVRVGYTDLETEDGVVSTEEFAPQLAGIIAANGPFRSITANHISGMRVSQKPSKADLKKARAAGVVMLVEDQLGARLYQDMTTYSSNTMYKPRKEFGVIKAVMVHHQIEMDLTRAAESSWIGGSNVNTANYRRAVLDGITSYLARIEGAAMILPGWEVSLDDEYDNTGDSIHVTYGIKTSRVVERILNTVVLY